jgi:hypothetical protein
MAEGSNSQRLDQAARSIDLASTVLKSSNLDLVSLVAQASTKAANEVLEWLAREKISKPAFVYTMTLGQNIAQPNLNGLQVLEELEQTSSKLYGMHLVMPGALGRKIIYDEQLRWVGTTEAVILKYHPPSYAVEALCDLFVLTSLEENDARAPAMKARVRPVISKMVDSVHLHTTNMVQGTKPLPAFLEALPKHYLATFTLADAIRTLQSLDKSDLLMKMSCCVIELVDWTLHHWNGKLTMAINNEILFDEQLGDSQYKLTVFIENHCTVDTDCHNDEHVHQFNIGKCVGISFTSYERLYTGITDPGIGCTNESSYRSPLYAIRNPFQSRHCSLNQKEQKAAERHAQEIVRSIVNLPVSPIGGESLARLGFRVDKKSNIMYRFWLKKTPTILQKNLGSNQPPRTIFDQVHASKEIVHDGDDSSGDGDDDVQYTPAQMARWYPEIHSGLTLAYERCECGCNANDLMEVLEQELDEGCLLALIFSEIMLHVAHAMGEAAGVSDVSNFQGPSTSINLSEAAIAFLGGIADYGEIFWDTWFRLAASLATGVPYDMGNEETFDVGGGLLFWVTGSMTIAPAWFKLDAEIKLEGSWGIQQLTGSLQGLGAEIAVIEAQCCSTATATNIPPPESTSGGEDVEDAQIETAIFSNTGDLYRIMCMVRTQKALRILNPIDVYHGAILAIRPSCTHERIEQIEVHPWSFNEILLGWNSWKTSDGDHAHVAFLDTPIKQNAAIGFAASRCVLSSKCCLRCLANVAKREGFYAIKVDLKISNPIKRLRYR